MATEIVHWCDWHIADEHATRVLATVTHAVVIDGTESTLKLCDECHVKRWQPLAGFVDGFGTRAQTPAELARERKRDRDRERHRAKATPPADRPGGGETTVCPRCGKVTQSRTGLGAHGFHGHGIRGLHRLFDDAVPDGADT